MKKPNWQLRFKDLPEIPNSKRWISGKRETLEQTISKKLLFGETLSETEKNVMLELTLFYGILYKSLEDIDYTNFTTKDFENFKNYIFYAFNYTVILKNNVEIIQLYRVVINENIIGSKKSITKKGFLTYPPIHIVKKINKYNRANTPNTTLFYGSETIDTSLNEIKPKVGDIVTVGTWVPTRKCEFISFPISHSEPGFGINLNSTNAMKAVLEFKQKNDKMLTDFMEPYFYILGQEFSKPIKHHYEYLISSLFAESIFDNPQNKNTRFDIECIIYPSVGNKFKTSNVAVRKDVFRHNFELKNVKEFEITETHYDRQQSILTDEIKLVEFKNFKETSNINGNDIIW